MQVSCNMCRDGKTARGNPCPNGCLARMTDREDKIVEAMARAMCLSDSPNWDPDSMYQPAPDLSERPRWHEWREDAVRQRAAHLAMLKAEKKPEPYAFGPLEHQPVRGYGNGWICAKCGIDEDLFPYGICRPKTLKAEEFPASGLVPIIEEGTTICRWCRFPPTMCKCGTHSGDVTDAA